MPVFRTVVSGVCLFGIIAGFTELVARAMTRRGALERECPGRCAPALKTSLHIALFFTGNCVWNDLARQPIGVQRCVFLSDMSCPQPATLTETVLRP